MLVSYAIDSGSNTSVDYSRAEPQGSANNRINLNAGQKLTIRLHRPQRIGLTGEGFDYYDIGKMVYYIDIPNMPYTSSPSGSGPGRCDAQKVTDTFVDTPVNAASPPAPLEMTVDIDQCFLNAGKTWNSGTRLDLDIQVAAPNGGNSAQKIFLYR